MANQQIFSDRELSLLKALLDHNVEFMIVGLSAAALQGAPVVTQDVDLWIRDLSDPRFPTALKSIKAAYVPPMMGRPPMIAGKGLGLFDIVITMSGLGDFDQEVVFSHPTKLGRITVPVLSLERIIASKKAANRPKDKLVLPVLKDSLKVLKKL